jgi:hypothetical protein
LHRENRRFPWRKALTIITVVLLLIAGAIFLAITTLGYKVVPHWPFMVR